MPELLLGGSGRLGSALRGVRSFVAPVRSELDLVAAPDAELGEWVAAASGVINAAAMANVDACESRTEACEAINADLPRRLARHCRTCGVPLVHISTDYVFGRGAGPCCEDDPPCPVQTYGAAKARGEAAALHEGATVARVSWLFGPESSPFGDHVLRQAEAGGPVAVLTPQYSRPTPIGSLAVWLVALLDHLVAGGSAPPILHPAGGPAATRRHWARAILDARGYGHLDVVDQPPMALPAQRPPDCRLDATKTQRWARSAGLPEVEDWRDAVISAARR